jgi:hypothetical protein
MAIAFAEETLRALQDAFSIYEAILAEYATVSTFPRPHSTRHHPHRKEFGDLVEGHLSDRSLVGMPSLRDTTGLEAAILVQ